MPIWGGHESHCQILLDGSQLIIKIAPATVGVTRSSRRALTVLPLERSSVARRPVRCTARAATDDALGGAAAAWHARTHDDRLGPVRTSLSAIPEAPQLLQVGVDGYKNVRRVTVDWSRVNVLFGANAAGKTNLLECFALLFGTDRTLELVRRRATLPISGSLHCVARVSARELPYPPDVARELLTVPPLASRAAQDLAWWSSLGATAGTTFDAAMVDTGLPVVVVEELTKAAVAPVVRYRLDLMERFSSRARTFSRTLTLSRDAVEAIASAMSGVAAPAAFSPLGVMTRDPSEQTHAGVLLLPPSDTGPARLEWLAAARSSDEVREDLTDAFARASAPTRALADDIRFLVAPDDPDEDPQGSWWIHEVGASAATAELAMTTRAACTVTSVGADDADWAITSGGREVASTLDDGFLEGLSSGERRWVDEALATLARSVDDHGRRCGWQDFFWSRGEDAFWKHIEAQYDISDGDPDAVAVLARIVEELPALSRNQEYVDADTLAEVAGLLDRHLWAEATSWLARAPVLAEMTIALLAPAVDSLANPRLTIRVFDEPEAHLHPAGQRGIRDALRTLGNAGDDILLATHSPYLLNVEDWSYLRVDAGQVRPLKAKDLQAGRAFARQIGLTTGELLVNTRAVLVVEGKHDKAFLEALYQDQLHDAGVVLLPIHGTDNSRALLDSEFWRNYASIPFAVMFDNVRLEHVDDLGIPEDDLTHEEQTFRKLSHELTRPWHRIGLDRPDITAYLHEEVLASYSRFPGWARVIDDFRRLDRPGFKDVLATFGVNLRATATVAELANAMRNRGLRPPEEIDQHISALCALASSG